MKLSRLILILALLVNGCTYNYPYSRSSLGSHAPPDLPGSPYSLVNNTGYKLRIYQDGKYIGDAQVGEVIPVRGALLWRKTVVTVTGYDAEGSYIGSDSWIYEFGTPEVWTVHKLYQPRGSR